MLRTQTQGLVCPDQMSTRVFTHAETRARFSHPDTWAADERAQGLVALRPPDADATSEAYFVGVGPAAAGERPDAAARRMCEQHVLSFAPFVALASASPSQDRPGGVCLTYEGAHPQSGVRARGLVLAWGGDGQPVVAVCAVGDPAHLARREPALLSVFLSVALPAQEAPVLVGVWARWDGPSRRVYIAFNADGSFLLGEGVDASGATPTARGRWAASGNVLSLAYEGAASATQSLFRIDRETQPNALYTSLNADGSGMTVWCLQ
eukprot:m51a1_g7338 hypothetical protein (265) ;mRNA; f:199086-199959